MMYKEELILKVSRETRLTKRIVSDVLRDTLKQITMAVAEGKKVTLLGFGVFEARPRREVKVKHVRTGQMVTVPARRFPIFRPADLLKRAVRRSGKPASSTGSTKSKGSRVVDWLRPKKRRSAK